MNTLSWYIYIADLCNSMPAIVIGITFFIIILMFISAMSQKYDEPYKLPKVVYLIPPLWSIAFLIPSKDTVLKIAASELGEKVLESKISSKAADAIDLWLDSQIKTLKESNGQIPKK